MNDFEDFIQNTIKKIDKAWLKNLWDAGGHFKPNIKILIRKNLVKQ